MLFVMISSAIIHHCLQNKKWGVGYCFSELNESNTQKSKISKFYMLSSKKFENVTTFVRHQFQQSLQISNIWNIFRGLIATKRKKN